MCRHVLGGMCGYRELLPGGRGLRFLRLREVCKSVSWAGGWDAVDVKEYERFEGRRDECAGICVLNIALENTIKRFFI